MEAQSLHLYAADEIPLTAMVYHGSLVSNLNNILLAGIHPRSSSQCEFMVGGWLAEYGVSREEVPGWVWKYAQDRCGETVSEIYLSGDRDYAWGNSQAGKEAEVTLRTSLNAWLKESRGERLSSEERMAISDAVHEPFSVLFRVKIPTSWILRLGDYESRIKHIKDYHHSSREEAWEYFLSLGTITVKEVPPANILDYEIVPYPPPR